MTISTAGHRCFDCVILEKDGSGGINGWEDRVQNLAIGLIILAVTAGLLRVCLPRNEGKPRWFIGTRYEPYIGVLFALLPVLGIGFIIGSIIQFTIG